MKKIGFILLLLSVFCFCFNTVCATDELVSKWDIPPLTPPENTHPRVYFTQTDISDIVSNMTSDENKYATEQLEKYVESEIITSSNKYNETTLAIIESKAFYYIIKKDSEAGTDAVSNGISAIKSMVPTGSNISRYYGRMINVLAEIYDWCNELLTDTQKQDIIDTCIEYAKKMEMGWPPSEQGAVTGHGSENQLLRDLLSFSIAVYDERPDIWNYIGGRFYAEYVPAREFSNKSHYNHQGTNYGFYREVSTDYAYMLITGMGHEEPYSGYDVSQTGFSEIYLRRPDGIYLSDGDIYSDTTPSFSYRTNDLNGMLMKAAIGNDGYLKGEYFRRAFSLEGNLITQSFTDSPVLFLIYNDPEVEAKTLSELPLSRYFGSPIGMMVARTGFDDGTTSDSVVAMMKIGEYQFNNHQHLDSGSFQIYYKGLLAAESGNYSTYGDAEHIMYTSKSIAHNTMLVYDPAEDDGTETRKNINDGGQRAVSAYGEFGTHEAFLNNDTKVSEILAHEIDPENTQSPYYTYIKGDLSNAYTDKVEEFKRSFMFLNLKDDETQAALIVFDKVKSSDPTFKKTWLLHGVQKPSVNKNISVFTNTGKNNNVSYNGQMEVQTLLPALDNLSIEVIGGKDEGWGIVNSYEYDETEETWKVTASTNYVTENTSDYNELNTYRLEVSPKSAAQEDYFLNVILIKDAGEAVSVEAPLLENDNFYGTVINDRVVFFAKTGEDNEAFSYELSGNGSYRWTICDMAQGTYKVTENGSSQMICASDEGGILSFIAPAGNIVIEKIDDIYTLPVDTPYKNEDTTYIKYGNSFINTVDIELQNSDIIVDLEVFAENLGYDVQKNITDEDTIYKILKDGQVFASLKMSDGVFLTKNGIGYTENSPYVNVDGKCKILLKDLYKIFYGSKMNMDYANMVLLNPIDYMNRTIYATSYLNGNELKVNVELINDLSVNMICGIFKDDVLIEAKAIEKISDGRYSVNFDILDSDNLEVKIFPWGDGLYPFNSLLINKNFTDDELLKSLWDSDGTLKISGTGTKVEKDGDVVTVTKTDTKSETRATASLGAVYQLGETGSGGYVHYSTIIRINSLSNFDDIIQFRVRGESDLSSTYKSYAFTASPGDGFKFDCIVDLRNACAYYYINGEKVGTADLSDWKYSDGSLGKLTSFQHYFITSPGVKDGTIELYDTYVAIYSAQTNLEKIVGNIGNILLKK